MATDFSGASILARAFLQNQHLCHIFNLGIMEKIQKEEPALPSAVVPSWTNDRREIPIYPRLLCRKAPDPRADWSTAQKSSYQHWSVVGPPGAVSGPGHGQLCSPPHPWQPPASALHHPCPPSCRAKLTSWLWLWGIMAAGNIYRSQETLQLSTIFLMALTMKTQQRFSSWM